MAKTATTVRVVSDLMTSDTIPTGTGDSVTAARRILLASGLHALPAVDSEGMTVGVVTLLDLDSAATAADPVNSVMSQPVITIEADSSVAAAAELMMAEGIHHLVVTEGQATVGLISTFDLLVAVASPRE